MAGVREVAKWIIRSCSRFSWFRTGFAHFLFGKIFEISPKGKRIKPKPGGRLDQPNCLILHSDLFRGDLEALASTGRARIFVLPTGLQQLVQQAFYPGSVDIVDYYHAGPGSDLEKYRYSLALFLAPFFEVLKSKFCLNFVIAPNFRHTPDLDWGYAGQAAGIFSVVLFREGLVNFNRAFEGTLLRQKKFGKIKADYLFLVNRHIKRVMRESGFAEETQIRVVGTPRMDRLVKRAIQTRNFPNQRPLIKLGKPKIMLFYFWPGKFQSGFFDSDGLWRPPGVPERLFFQVFQTIFDFAEDHSNIDLLIKVKKDQPTLDYLNRIFGNATSQLAKRETLRIETDIDLHLEMETASGIVGLNSTAVLESGLFGSRVIVPFFREFRGSEWSERFGLRSDLAAFDVPDDHTDFRNMLERCLVDPVAPSEQLAKRLLLFEEWVSSTDGQASERCVKELTNLLGVQTQEAPR